MQTTPATVKKSKNQNETPSVERQIIEADKASSKDVAAGDASNNNKNSVYQKKKPYNPANKRYAIPWVTKFPMALHEEIWSFSQWLTPTTEEQSMRQDVVNRLRKIVLKLWPEASVVPYGSFETNLCVPTSDIDVVIFGAQPIDDKSPLAILAEALEEEELPAKPPKVIASAKVPIVKFHDRKSGCLVDISFDITTGIANTKIIKDFLNQYPLLRPLALVIKFYLKQRYLNDTWSGGIGSYTLIMMIISYLQLHTKSKGQFPQSDAATNSDEGENNNNNNVPGAPDDAKEDLASMLTGFFELYGSKFDYLTSVISILDGGKYLSKEDKKWIHPDALDALSVEDPQNTDNDVGLACFKIKEAKKAFADAFAMLTGPKKYISESLLGKLVRVPLSLVQQRQRVVKSKSGRELTDENSSEAGPENQHEVDAEEKRLTYNYHNRYKSYTRNNDVWYHNKPPTASNNNNTNQQPNNTNTNAGADSSTTAQRVPTNNNNNTAQNQHYLPPHRRQQQARAPAPANTNSATSSTVSSAGTSPTNNSPLLAISVPLVVPALNDKTATQSSTNNNRTTQQQRKGPQQNNSNHNSGTSHHGSRNSNAHHSKSSNTNGSQNSTSHSPASTSPRVTSSNNPSNTPVHSGHNNNSNGNNNRQSSNQSRSGSNNNRSNNNRNNNNNNKGRSNHNNHNNVANTHDDDEIKNDEHNFPMLSATKDSTVHENKIAQKASDTTNTNRPQHVNNTTTNGNNGAAQQNANNNKSDKKNKRRQNTVLISA